MELYDYQYIDEKILGGIDKNVPNVAFIITTVEKQATGRITSNLSQSAASQSAVSDTHSAGGSTTGPMKSAGVTPVLGEEINVKKVTEQRPFNLTKPKPKKIMEPEAIVQQTVAKPVPAGLFKKTLDQVEKEKEERRKANTEAIRKGYEDDPKKTFDLTTAQRPTVNKVQDAKDRAEQELQNKLNFSGTKPRRVPDFDKIAPEVKMTKAAVKAEALALKKAEEKEAKRLKDLEWNQRDETEFETWKKEMDEREEILNLDYIQRRKIQMELSREEAILAQ